MAPPDLRLTPPDDRPALYRRCLPTADSGENGTAMYENPRLVGHVLAGPHLRGQPEPTFVLEDAAGVCGYVLGVRDTRAFRSRGHPRRAPPTSGWPS
ncbi:hypothetical protein [Deinococcus petrolearius]|uniref:Uncharacterized protein n=1 Tax=Deinococcus petrolearius TaxID=1751295 RepID=A0ABW1DHA8_9DEIO